MICGVISLQARMRFKFLENQDERCYIEDFLSELDEETYLKITNKLKDFESFDQVHLFRAEHIKKVEIGIYEVRVKVKGECYRFLGKIDGENFYIAHVYHKKSKKLPPKEIKTTRQRLITINL